MKNLDTSFISMEIGSIALGYRVLKSITDAADTEKIRILDASPAGARFLILALGETKTLHEATQKARASLVGAHDMLIDSVVLENFPQEVADALFALARVQLEEALVVVECGTVSGCLKAAHILVSEHKLKPIELRIQRASTGGAYGFLTGEASACRAAAESVLIHMREEMRSGRIEVLESNSQQFRSFFELKG